MTSLPWCTRCFLPEKLNVEAVYAAPFTNDRSTGPGDGMEKSYEEILRLLERLHMDAEGFVYRGSDYLSRGKPPQRSAAVDDPDPAGSGSPPDDDPLYVVAIGAITNVTAALLLEPRSGPQDRGDMAGWEHAPPAVHDGIQPDAGSGCRPGHFRQRRAVRPDSLPGRGFAPSDPRSELDETIKGRNAISDFLYERFVSYSSDHFAWAKIWDISAIAYLLDELHADRNSTKPSNT